MPGHARSFSNDRVNFTPLEPRRSRRVTGNTWETTPASSSDPSADEDQSYQFPTPGPPTASGSGSGSGPGAMIDSDNPHHRDLPHDAESLRPLTPIAEKPSGRGGAASSSAGGPVTWMGLPRKDQLIILFIGRLVDFLQVASMQAYVFFQLKSFDSSLSDSQVSQQAGLLQGCFTGAQVLTAILWGKAADASWCGRKWVLVVGLGGTALSCIGYGFATTFFWAAFWRAFGGAINGTVGIM